MKRRLRVLARRPSFHAGVDLLIAQLDCDGDIKSVAGNLVFTEVAPDIYVEPTIVLTGETAQALMDELYAIGLRPTDAVDSAGALKATSFHLEDMRRLVFDKVKQ
jgi:hypothetical protein